MPTLSSLLPAISFFFLFNLPPSILCRDDYRFSNCSQEFACGRFNNISYPFWSGIQPEYCGLTGFQLQCEYGIPTIQIMSQQYRVLEMKPESQTLIIARNDTWKGKCVTGLYDHNTFLDHNTVFNLSDSANQNLTLFYDCPPSLPFTDKFQCVIFGNTSDAWISSDAHQIDMHRKLLNECKYEIGVPVLRTGLSLVFKPKEQKIEDVLKVGFEVKYSVNVSICGGCENSGGRCGFNRTTQEFTCFCRDGPNQLRCKAILTPTAFVATVHGIARKMIMIIIVVVAFGILITVLATIVTCRLRKKSNTSIISRKNKGNTKAIEDFFKDCELLAPKGYKYKDIKKMTNSFQDNIGQGGFGSVFKGKLPDGRVVAVKILSETKGDGNDFINEVACIGRTSHVNIVTLLGFCIDGQKRALVYEFMPNGSLEKFIYGERPLQTRHLGWEALYKVAIGIARGLEYLHRGCNTRIVHFDIKPHNILLDENLIPKIADFGLSKLSHVAQSIISMTGARGTPGYIAPELLSRSIGEVSHKSDVYSYGMMVLEMVGGRKNIDARVTNISEIYFPHWIHKRLDMNEDLGLHGVTSLEDQGVARKMILVGLWCIQLKPASRPPMNKVLEMLEGNLEALQFPPKPYLSSPPNENEGSHSSIPSLCDI